MRDHEPGISPSGLRKLSLALCIQVCHRSPVGGSTATYRFDAEGRAPKQGRRIELSAGLFISDPEISAIAVLAAATPCSLVIHQSRATSGCEAIT